ncbi:MAG: DsbA family protein [Candidatus Woesearchaeota archaeon]
MKKDSLVFIAEVIFLVFIVLFVLNLDYFFPLPEIPEQVNRLNITYDSTKLQVIEFSDFECPFCADVHTTVNRVREEYAGIVEVHFKPLPFHKNSQKASEAVECARDQGIFWEYHNKLFENQGRLGVPQLKVYAGQVGLDVGSFSECLDSGENAQVIAGYVQEASGYGISATPTFIIGTRVVPGNIPLSQFERLIDEELGG